MIVNIDGTDINYEVSGEGADVLVLHGWGANIPAVLPIVNSLMGKMRVWAIDFPGFGKSALPPENWDVYSYADLVKKFVDKMEIKTPVLIGHSFGGRVCIILAGKKMLDINKIVLVDAAGIKPKHGMGYYFKVYSYKVAKKVASFIGRFSKETEENIKSLFGSSDYKNANPVMRNIMVRVVNEDLQYLLPQIDKPTLLIYGSQDDATPVSDAKIMEKLIPDSGLVVLEGAGHFSYIDKNAQFGAVVRKFLENDMKA